jgi:carbon monoxide dehydrogenase subunit G
MKPHSNDTVKLLRGEVLIELIYLDDDVISASGKISISARPTVVWQMLTDYGNLHRTMPKVTSSKLVEDNGSTKIIDQSGKTGIFIFERSVHFRLHVLETYPEHLHFSQISGDFLVYEGEWLLAPHSDGNGTFLSYEARIKPDFFAPPFLVSFVQSQDLPLILNGVRSYCQARNQG